MRFSVILFMLFVDSPSLVFGIQTDYINFLRKQKAASKLVYISRKILMQLVQT